MTTITELDRLLDAKQAAEREWEKYADVLVPSEESRHAALIVGRARNRWIGALTDDTLRALIDEVEAAQRQHDDKMVGCPFCAATAPTPHDEDCPLASLFPDTCTTCHGHGGGGGFDRNGSHNAGEYQEYPCPECGKEADHA